MTTEALEKSQKLKEKIDSVKESIRVIDLILTDDKGFHCVVSGNSEKSKRFGGVYHFFNTTDIKASLIKQKESLKQHLNELQGELYLL